jgi:hypothetical protein
LFFSTSFYAVETAVSIKTISSISRPHLAHIHASKYFPLHFWHHYSSKAATPDKASHKAQEGIEPSATSSQHQLRATFSKSK